MLRTIVIFGSGMLIGGFIGFVWMGLLACQRLAERESGNYESTIPQQRTCQIHQSYACLDDSECKGNPTICEMAVKK